MKKIYCILTSAIVIVLFVLFLPSILGIFSKDIAPINDSDLQLKNITIPEADNAYFDLIKIEDGLIHEPAGKDQQIQDIIEGKDWNEYLVQEIADRNSQALEYFAEAARKPKFQIPAYADPSKITISTVLPSLNNARRMGQISALRAIYLSRFGKSKEAMDEAMNAVRVGQKIQDSQAPLVEYLAAMSMKNAGLKTVQRIIALSRLSNEELNQVNQELSQFYKNEDGLVTALKSEYRIQSQEVDSIASGSGEGLALVAGENGNTASIAKKAGNNFYFHPNETKAIFAEYARAGIKNADKLCGEVGNTDVRRLAPVSPFKLYITENAIGKILHDTVVFSLSSVNNKKCEEDLLVGSTQVIIAIKAFKSETGNYPASLSELAPKYLPAVPPDPYDGKPLRYSAEGKIVYSVGADMTDAGGSTGNDWRTMADPTFKISF